MGLAVWRDISLLWLIFLTFIAVLPFGILFFFAIRGMHRLRQLAKKYLTAAQQMAAQIADVTEKGSKKVANPFIEVQARVAEVDGIVNTIVTTKTLTRRKQA
jgi:hypothetical protein